MLARDAAPAAARHGFALPGAGLILVAGREPNPEMSGGHAQFVIGHALAAKAAGYEPHIVCVAPRSGELDTPFGRIHRIASPARPFRQTMIAGHALRLASAIESIGRRLPAPLLLHGFGVWSFAAVLAGRRLARKGMAAVPLASAYTTYEGESRGKVAGLRGERGRWSRRLHYRLEHAWIRCAAEPFERRGYGGARLVLVNYDSIARLLVERHGSGLPIRKIPYASPRAFDEDGAAKSGPARAREADRAPRILAISRHGPRKGIDVLLGALAKLAARGVRFHAELVGGGPLLAEHRRLAERLELGAHVAIRGVVPRIAPYLERCDVFVLPSRSEQSGSLAVLEALQAGCAIIASSCDGIPEDLEGTGAALLVPPGDADALAAALERVLAAPALRAELGARARVLFERRFSAAAFSQALAVVYRELANGHRTGLGA